MAVCLLAPPLALSSLATQIAGVGTNLKRAAHRRVEGSGLTAIVLGGIKEIGAGMPARQSAHTPIRPLFHVKQFLPFGCPSAVLALWPSKAV